MEMFEISNRTDESEKADQEILVSFVEPDESGLKVVDTEDFLRLSVNFKFSKSAHSSNRKAIKQAFDYCYAFNKITLNGKRADEFEKGTVSYSLDASKNKIPLEDYLRGFVDMERKVSKASDELYRARQSDYVFLYNLSSIYKYKGSWDTELMWPEVLDDDGYVRKPIEQLRTYSSYTKLAEASRSKLDELKKIIQHYSLANEWNQYYADNKQIFDNVFHEYAKFILCRVLRLNLHVYDDARRGNQMGEALRIMAEQQNEKNV